MGLVRIRIPTMRLDFMVNLQMKRISIRISWLKAVSAIELDISLKQKNCNSFLINANKIKFYPPSLYKNFFSLE